MLKLKRWVGLGRAVQVLHRRTHGRGVADTFAPRAHLHARDAPCACAGDQLVFDSVGAKQQELVYLSPELGN